MLQYNTKGNRMSDPSVCARNSNKFSGTATSEFVAGPSLLDSASVAAAAAADAAAVAIAYAAGAAATAAALIQPLYLSLLPIPVLPLP